ncbi:MAG: TldD/PmbA family protein [Candidatus Marinimicrobia bacterium]|jgi:TldD protein|nr:TldD/PmbA family protein [Candidatus Neomarinimicrobiota bacterium]MBT3824539.1 TldD/PmbA family protein [Candidatus Neomarinimicrobiota bacterium]MBT4129320.1 TldD/PmbA family protein [Candidatus Neomarinimicrobiota bacterium]MBT4296831.1 TldD/PmbA family protein [Candidatus Neomarinimicrobiota bacterium]MBT4419903.1 TldD/PmbA family protein [Candidatus Neomarinimicrobiota bacterium]
MVQMSRRDFVKVTGTGLALATLPGFIRSGFAGVGAGDNPYNFYFQRFGIDEDMIRKVMAEALHYGGDYCDLFFQNELSNSIRLQDNIVNSASTNVTLGVGIRVLNGNQTGYSFTEDISLASMKAAARTAAGIASGSAKAAPQTFNATKLMNYYETEISYEDVGVKDKVDMLQAINDDVFKQDARVVKANVNFSDSENYILVVNSEGGIASDYQPMLRISVGCTAEEDGKRENNYFDYSVRDDINFLTEEKLKRLPREAVARTVKLFEAQTPPAGEMPVVLAAGSSGILLHEAIGHGMEADFNRQGISVFSDMINKKVAEDFVTIVDNGTNPHVRGSINVDDEGHPSEETQLVENGVLRSYIHDRISAKHYGVDPTGSGRRESFKHYPLPRMRNTYMKNGPHTFDEIIANVKYGIVAEQFTNGQVNIGPGDFTFYVKSGSLIEDGKITGLIKDVNIIGNGPEVLSRVTMVANDMKMAEGGWTCGKNGQSVPVSMGLPSVLVSSITVGGRG